jgi:AhpD family alkylhydroperoxidase
VKKKNGFEKIIEEILEKGAKETSDSWIQDIRNDLGRVPLIFERMAERPEVFLSHLMYKNAVLKTSPLEPKYVELISLAVASALRCNYCTDYHLQAAIKKGATKEEVLEAILIAGLTSQSGVLADAYRTFSESMEQCEICGVKGPNESTE